MRHEVRDPRFLPDLESNSKHISGLLFYTVQGEKGVAMARVTIDLSLYGKSVSYINHFNIRTDVLRSSSLAQQEQNETAVNISQLLVTGVGRTGTTSVCTLMQKLDIHVSHDNNVDCGSYPGADGAVSWYDAFTDRKHGRRYKHVIHLVRDPLKTINSRIHKCKTGNFSFLKQTVKDYEKVSEDETCFSFSIKNWVRRNSFVSLHASWVVKSEDFFTEALSVWEVCMAATKRCPDLTTIAPVLESIPSTLNSNYHGAVLSKEKLQKNQTLQQDNAIFYSWKLLAHNIGENNHKFIQIAQEMAYEYGYAVPVNFTSFGYNCKFTEKDGEVDKYWDCNV